MPPSSPPDWIALSLLPGLGPRSLHRALERFESAADVAYRIPAAELLRLAPRARTTAGEISAVRRRLARVAEREWKRCRQAGIGVLTWAGCDYPVALREIDDPPVLLYIRGRLPHKRLRVAVVGSRSPTAYGRRVAVGLASGLAAREIDVVSGGARGIDSDAHRGALEEGGRTVAILGSGLLRPYPAENRELFGRIAEAGAVLSEMPLDMEPHRENFPRRNRLISGLSAAVVVVEAARRSGSLSTASHALDQGREVLAVPGPVSSSRSAGTHLLIQQGAKLVQNIEDILVELPEIYRVDVPVREPGQDGPDLVDLTADEAAVLKMLDPVEAVHVDDLAERAPLGIARLQAALFGLEGRGAVDRSPGRYYLLRPRKEP